MRLPALVVSAAMLAAATAASADPIADRKADMKERAGLLRVLAPIAQGKADFDAAVVLDALEKLDASAKATDVAVMWAEGTDKGDTKSSPRIWEDMAGFKALADKYEADVAAALAANPQDLATFQNVFGAVAANCGACHQKYRL